jgi:predicted RNA-binding protein with PUA-like domain
MVCFSNLEIFLATDNIINDIFELTYLSNLKHLDIQNNKIYDVENFDFLNMLENVEYINISNNPFIEKLDTNTLSEYFSIKANQEKNEDSNLNVEIEKNKNFEQYSLNEIKEKEELKNSIRMKKNNSKVFICKIY